MGSLIEYYVLGHTYNSTIVDGKAILERETFEHDDLTTEASAARPLESFINGLQEHVQDIKKRFPGARDFGVQLEDSELTITFQRPMSEREQRTYDKIKGIERSKKEKAIAKVDEAARKAALDYIKKHPELIDEFVGKRLK